MKNIPSLFRFFALFWILAGIALANNPSVAKESGKQYAESTQGNNSLMINPMNLKLYGGPEVEAVKSWGINSPDSIGWGEIFTFLQGHYFSSIFALVILFTILAFLGHYMVIGQKKFNHGKKIRVFSTYNILIHWCAAIPFMLVCLTGLIMVFGDKLGGGVLVRFARDIHGIATIVFVIFGILMFLMWVRNALPNVRVGAK